ncbi:hypothetical protein BT96DRAFT_101822 [Gymnopus androsaceus JB14]|uniref:Uncharacterized protein n=1 Tax=Gymnopus androsaceus JB14 TaxID=1447944 RepID=A0A6A4HFQ2_9AGAR|nr:hypothetical protein BT96DRAFT_101822 [Gymnopus androsaceus JB14]
MSSVGNESDASSYVDSALLASLSDFDSPSFAIGIPSPAASSARKSLSEDSFVFVDDDSSFIDPDLLVNWSDFGYGPPQACATSPSAMGTSMPGGWIFTPAKASAQREMALGSLCSASGLSSFGSLLNLLLPARFRSYKVVEIVFGNVESTKLL